ncbi:MAG TPA: hypothetical protein VGX51_03525 [Solirubrobacteraceae bacterium]|jgi:hypothetical protein|nr:hypothetical protein [Solirubrobacteraceae bacterium]
MARHHSVPRRTQSAEAYLRATRALAALALLAFAGGIVSDELEGSFWSDHALLAGLASSVIVVMLTVALVNEVIERRSRQRWSVLAQYVMLQLVRDARFVWTALAELAGLMPSSEYATDVDLLATAASIDAGSQAVRDTPRLTAALHDLLADHDKRRRLHDKVVFFVDHNDEVLGRWAAVMLNSDLYAEVIDRHVELAGDLAWLASLLGSTLDDDAEHALTRRPHPSALMSGPVDDDQLAQRVAAITQLAEQLDRGTLALALRIVPFEWWGEQLGVTAPNQQGDRKLPAPERSLP